MTSLVCQLLPCREKRESAGLSVVVACRWARRSCPGQELADIGSDRHVWHVGISRGPHERRVCESPARWLWRTIHNCLHFFSATMA